MKMSRKSARLQRIKKDTSEEVEIVPVSRKRKAEEELERDGMEVSKRRQQFQIQNQWVPISEDSSVVSCTIVSIPNQDSNIEGRKTPPQLPLANNFRFQNYFTTPVSLRNSPLPTLYWADSQDLWTTMLKKDELYTRDKNMLSHHPQLRPGMRAILIDWLIEVCEVYRLHRETNYLAIDFIDRYLNTQSNIQKQQLQLIGITSLFIAAKLEEIYPPKLTEFAYVTDGACTENEILEQELIILKALKWDLSPMTPNLWLNMYMQLINVGNMKDQQHNFVYPQYSAHAFIQIGRLLDLCMLDIESLQFSYSVLATAALYHKSSEHIALSVSGFKWEDILPCIEWMTPYALTLNDQGTIDLKFFPNIPTDSTHNIQTHTVDLNLLEKAQNRRTQIATSSRISPDITTECPGIITPPQSNKKYAKELSE